MRVLVTGGAGYVGSHCVKDLCECGHEVTVYDDLSRGHRGAVHPGARLIVGSLNNAAMLESVLTSQVFDAVMHFAAFAYVGESVNQPLMYYRNNTTNTLTLLELMARSGVRRLVFSSTCASYGTPERVPIPENTPQAPINPYGRSKLAVEWMLADSAMAWGLGSCALRYFNACGAAEDGSIGEDHDPETHLIPIVLQAALGQRPQVSIFGTDYPTPDGTCIRDYIHVEDLAEAHRRVLEEIKLGESTAYNVGTGRGHSVREIIKAVHNLTGKPIGVVEESRRPGDPPRLIADAARIQEKLGWQASWTDIEKTIASAWKWHQSHPLGFGDQ